MFCLRSWVPLLIFLTNASPIYVLIFLSANYALQRPCVYCSVLLFVLVISLFDFSADWFEPRWPQDAVNASETLSSFLSGNATFTDTLIESAAMAVTAVNGTGGSLASIALNGLKRGASSSGSLQANASASMTSAGAEWVKSFVEKRQYRIPCLDIRIGL